jgi:hypothetical protein
MLTIYACVCVCVGLHGHAPTVAFTNASVPSRIRLSFGVSFLFLTDFYISVLLFNSCRCLFFSLSFLHKSRPRPFYTALKKSGGEEREDKFLENRKERKTRKEVWLYGAAGL